MTFISLLTTAISSIIYGIVFTAVVMALLYFLLKTIGRGIVQTIVFYITGVVLALLLIIQFSLLCGAYQAKDAADSAEIYLEQLLEGHEGTIGAQESQHILDSIIEEYPIIGSFIGVANFSGQEFSDLAETMHETMIGFLNSYIWHRVWWIFGSIIAACLIVILYDRGYRPNNHSDYNSEYGGLQF